VQVDVTGQLVKPESVEELAGALQGMIGQSRRAKEMGDAAFRFVKKRIPGAPSPNVHIALYQTLIAGMHAT